MTILVIGSGSIGTRHVQNLTALGVPVEGLSMRRSGLAGALARIAAGGLRGVVIATETGVRLPLVEAAAAQGLAMYIEKPLTHDPVVLERLFEIAAPVAERSMVGYMMRYHPAVRYLAQNDLSDTYRYTFEIGHDVTQWRANWRFADSYAARPEGGGVLLDLCHELDLAACLFPAATLKAVVCLGHVRYPGVDFATRINLGGPALGSVAMDYLSPVSFRRIEILGLSQRISFDLGAGRYMVGTAAGTEDLSFPVERNSLFLAAMRDFLALLEGQPTGAGDLVPRLDRMRGPSGLVAEAYAMRLFAGELTGDKP